MKNSPHSGIGCQGWINTGSRALLLSVLAFLIAAPISQAAITSIAKVRELMQDDLKLGLDVQLEGIVVGRIQRTGRLLIQHDNHGVVVDPGETGTHPSIGARVMVEGATTWSRIAPIVARKVTILARGQELPAAETVELSVALQRTPLSGRLVEVSGLVQGVTTNYVAASILRNRVTLKLRQGHRVLHVIAPRPAQQIARRINLAHIRAKGILFNVLERKDVVRRVLWTTSWKDVAFDQDGPVDPFARPVESLAAVADSALPLEDEPIRIRAHVLDVPDRGKLKVGYGPGSDTSEILIRHESQRNIQAGDVLDLLGFPNPGEDGSHFEMVNFRWLGVPGDVPVPELSDYVGVASTSLIIGDLTDKQVERQWPVRMFGTVTYRDTIDRMFYMQSGAGKGVKVSWTGTNDPPTSGERILLFGHADFGVRSPIVIGHSMVPPRRWGQSMWTRLGRRVSSSGCPPANASGWTGSYDPSAR